MKRDSFSHLANGPRILADIGGSSASFGLETAPNQIEAIWLTECAAYPTLGAAMVAYLSQAETVAAGGYQARFAGIAIANPIDGDWVTMTNHHWSFSIEAVCSQFSLKSLVVVNDFTALASALPYLAPEQKHQIGAGVARAGATIGLVGADAGLGVSGLVPAGDRWIAIDSEGGHATFAPMNEREIDILRYARRYHEHVSSERLVSGIGLSLVYRALCERARVEPQNLSTGDIMDRGLHRLDPVCEETLLAFCEMLGTVAGNVALTLGAKGGIYIGGRIVLKMSDFFERSGFRARFEQKGRFSDYLAHIPTYVITEKNLVLSGMSAMLAAA
ncbi:glucokinase [Duganella sacchari]|uniref:Glucokinase n=1 Tax=Duganella sacchari TaxID=551987 RepID=A0A1M7R1B8_9BURK|nr:MULTISPECIES: glucokinase [Duganella]MYM32577.1 glucokinase [Duganella sp. CY15W]SHN38220.1 glucokinase [Duganella sacchari]